MGRGDLEQNLRPLAVAWRQMVFYLSLLIEAEQRTFAAHLGDEITRGRAPATVSESGGSG